MKYLILSILMMGCAPLTGADAVDECWVLIPEGTASSDQLEGELACEVYFCLERAVDPINAVEYYEAESFCLDNASDRYVSTRDAITVAVCAGETPTRDRHSDQVAWSYLCSGVHRPDPLCQYGLGLDCD